MKTNSTVSFSKGQRPTDISSAQMVWVGESSPQFGGTPLLVIFNEIENANFESSSFFDKLPDMGKKCNISFHCHVSFHFILFFYKFFFLFFIFRFTSIVEVYFNTCRLVASSRWPGSEK